MNLRTVNTIYRKEMLDSFRDKRAMIAMIGVPLLLYPIIFIVGVQFMMLRMTKMEATPSKVAIVEDGAEILKEWLAEIPLIDVQESESPEEDVLSGEIDAYVLAQGDIASTLEGGGTVPVAIHFDSTAEASRQALDRVEEGLRERFEVLLNARVDEAGLEESFVRPLEISGENITPLSKVTDTMLSVIIPLIIVVMLALGAFYPAVDLTAGEKERGTFETLLSTPASKNEIVAGKFLAIFTLSVLTGLLNLASITATMVVQLSVILSEQLENIEGADPELFHISASSIAAMVVVLIPLAFFISAMMMAAAMLARSFKEAQYYVTPLFMAVIFPAAIAADPTIELTRVTQFIPIANVSLLFRDLVMGNATLELTFVVFLTTVVYATLALLIAASLFQREEVILSEEKGIPLSFKRSQFIGSDSPTPGLAFGLFSVVMLLIFYGGSYAQSKNIHIGLVITEYGLILAPVLFVLWFVRVNIRESLNLRLPNAGVTLGTLILAPAWVFVIIQISVWLNKVLPVPEEFASLGEELFSLGDSAGGVLILIAVIALSPAICEEVLFRGAMLSGLKDRFPQWATVMIVGVAFGMFHLSIYRFVPTALSGLMLSYLVVRSGSIFPAMFAHFVLNGLSVLIETGTIPARILRYLEETNADVNGLPLWVFFLGLAVFTTGIGIVHVSTRRGTSV